MPKPFKETAVGKFLIQKAPKILGVIGDNIPPIKMLSRLIDLDPDMTPDDKRQAQKLTQDYELELFELETADRQNARQREVEKARTGKSDRMMTVTGIVGLGSFLLMVVAALFFEIKNESIFHQLIGLIEGVALAIFYFYYGTSKGSKDKDKN